MTRTTTWRYLDPQTNTLKAHSVQTTRNAGESLVDFAARHEAAVADDLVTYPEA